MNTSRTKAGLTTEEAKMAEMHERVKGHSKEISMLKRKVASLEKQLSKLPTIETKMIVFEAMLLEHVRAADKQVAAVPKSAAAGRKPAAKRGRPKSARLSARISESNDQPAVVEFDTSPTKKTPGQPETDITYRVVEAGTAKGKGKLFDSNGYSYTRKYDRRRDGATVHWRCTVRNAKIICTATVNELSGVFSKGLKDHNHPPKPPAELTPQKLRRRALRKLNILKGIERVKKEPAEAVTDATFQVLDSGTSRSQKKLIESTGYTYTQKCDRNRMRQDANHWRCTVRNQKLICPAAIHEVNGVYSRGQKEHIHPPLPHSEPDPKNLRRRARWRLRKERQRETQTLVELGESVASRAVESLLKQEYHEESHNPDDDHDYPATIHQEVSIEDRPVSKKRKLLESPDSSFTDKEVSGPAAVEVKQQPAGIQNFDYGTTAHEMVETKLGLLQEEPSNTPLVIPDGQSNAVASLTQAQLAQIANITGQASEDGSEMIYMYVVDDGTAVICNQPTPLPGGVMLSGNDANEISKGLIPSSSSQPSVVLPTTNEASSDSHPAPPVSPVAASPVKASGSTSSPSKVIRVVRATQAQKRQPTNARRVSNSPLKSGEDSLPETQVIKQEGGHLCHQCGLEFMDQASLQNHSLDHVV